jgi:hypothetical protein
MSTDDRRIRSGVEFEAVMFPKRVRARAIRARDDAEVRARDLGEKLADDHLRRVATVPPQPAPHGGPSRRTDY